MDTLIMTYCLIPTALITIIISTVLDMNDSSYQYLKLRGGLAVLQVILCIAMLICITLAILEAWNG